MVLGASVREPFRSTNNARGTHVPENRPATGALHPRHPPARPSPHPPLDRHPDGGGLRHPRRADAGAGVLRPPRPRRDCVRAVRTRLEMGHHLGHHLVRGHRPNRPSACPRPPRGAHGQPRLDAPPRPRLPGRGPGLPRGRHRHQNREPAQLVDPAGRRRRHAQRGPGRGRYLHHLHRGRGQPLRGGADPVLPDRAGRMRRRQADRLRPEPDGRVRVQRGHVRLLHGFGDRLLAHARAQGRRPPLLAARQGVAALAQRL